MSGTPSWRCGATRPVSLCAAVGLVPVDDPSNADPAYRRNRVRHELLPLLDAIAGRDVVAILARQASLLRAEAELLDLLAAELDTTDAKALAAAPVVLGRRAVRRWLSAGCDHPPDAAAVDRVLAVARGEARAADVGGGRRVARTDQRLRPGSPRPPHRTGDAQRFPAPFCVTGSVGGAARGLRRRVVTAGNSPTGVLAPARS